MLSELEALAARMGITVRAEAFDARAIEGAGGRTASDFEDRVTRFIGGGR